MSAAPATVGTFSIRTRCGRRPIPSFRCSLAGGVTTVPILTELKMKCATPLPLLQRIADAMASDMRAGLAADNGSDLKMILSYVDSLPTGNEKGLFYALDLGGTNFRVVRVQLGGKQNKVVDSEFEQVSIPQELMQGTTEELFNFIASKLANFAAKESGKFQLPKGRTREIGFTFSFPIKQTSINSGILIKWTKGFAVLGTVNDAVATLAGAKYWDDDVLIAVILGTGTNACYIERKDAIPKLQWPAGGTRNMIISTEWGAFTTDLPLTEFDKDMDSESINPGEQIFEKTISGMYLGEIVRRVLLKMASFSSLFGDSIPEKLLIPLVLRTRDQERRLDLLRTPDLCAMQQDDTKDLSKVEEILSNTIGETRSTLKARRIVVDVCDTIVKRGGRLAGAGIVGILQKMEQDSKGLISGKRTVVAMDGGLYEHYPQYRNYLKDAVAELLGAEVSKNIVIEHTKDGSGIGAALLAAANSKYASEFQI
ncbi:hexokinase-2, chloroplastic isoform X3 [Dendrobium catenatum]|uniref:hexokinase-2, chloroplastic isoform X3 n=1 Tax=Dendrobium catenatum TaxID=906689 RepID=UPI0010A0076F|nr:hexokinase-2, chloroplastic isoform X3 [Dendrobium catenatum]